MRLILLLVCLFLSACGQKGDLYLPGQEVEENETVETAEKEDDKDKKS